MKVQKCLHSCECTFQIHATAHVCGSTVHSINAAFIEWQEKLQAIFLHDKLYHSLIYLTQIKHIKIAETIYLAVKFVVVNLLC